ncbi:sigma-70 family RNA polymerase sigma factor [Rhizobium binae]|uniref:sigma-70 family RNA polymerase sigma factor n=1 Tax=Rhizobium binae TaxID=1138190 RepID=UPI001C8339F7|nr:sigma-70 family RNA polymerase sigma factor [Rhizobium binae]MBX4941142.1 sigma-70 family RNA polymerase sigma factor [Rhizobium binae]
MTTTTRPDGFDAALTAYLPALRRQAKYMAGARHEDLLQDTLVMMLSLAGKCRVETFRTWAQIMMRRAASNHKRAMRAEKRAAPTVDLAAAARVATPPAQEHAADLAIVTDALAGIKYGDIVLRRADDELLREIGEERGVGREAVRQLEAKARARLFDVLNMKEANNGSSKR